MLREVLSVSEQGKNSMRGWIWAASLLGVIAMLILVGVSSAYAAPVEGKKMLIIYSSWGGNTRYMAEQIQSLTGADIFELKTVNPYPTEYRPTTEQARRELDSGYRPPLSSKIDNLADYDIVFIGSPNWWGTLAMPFFTFLEEHNMAGKTLVPFMTHEGSAFGRTLTDLKNLCPNATILEGLAVRGGRVRDVQSEITQWLKRIGMIA
jgi:flavodoxin